MNFVHCRALFKVANEDLEVIERIDRDTYELHNRPPIDVIGQEMYPLGSGLSYQVNQ